MKIILTGGTVFLGSYLVEKLLHNNFNVIILKRSNSDLFRIRHLLPLLTAINIDQI